MRSAQVFISHSTRTKCAEAYLSALRKAFTGSGRVKEYWLDRKNLEPGDNWRAQIYQALRESDAAILLLTREAIEQSYFVQIEASYLSVQGTKPIIPILIDVKPEELDQGVWKALEINDRQAIQSCNPKE